jgi:hypothetical protein
MQGRLIVRRRPAGSRIFSTAAVIQLVSIRYRTVRRGSTGVRQIDFPSKFTLFILLIIISSPPVL